MITIDDVKDISYRTLYHTSMRNADGTPLRVRINGKCKLWKTRPFDFKLPIKYGLYQYGYITQDNANEWFLNEKDAINANSK